MEFGKRAAALEAQGHHVVELGIGEPDFGAPPAVLDAMREAMDGRPSFSKYFGMTGWRLGWCVAPEPLAVRESRRNEFADRRAVDVDGLERIGLPVPVPPDGAFYVYFDVSGTGLTSWEFCERVLQEAHVALTPGRDFGVRAADTHVRLSTRRR